MYAITLKNSQSNFYFKEPSWNFILRNSSKPNTQAEICFKTVRSISSSNYSAIYLKLHGSLDIELSLETKVKKLWSTAEKIILNLMKNVYY